MAKALIVYASFTGNTEEVAHILESALKQNNISVDLRECTQVNATDFLNYDICIVATYTWGREGELPDEMYDFYDSLGELDLSGKIYGVLGSGDTLYDEFCKSVDDFDAQFKKTNAIRGSDVVKVDDYPEEKDEKEISNFASNVINAFEAQKHLTEA